MEASDQIKEVLSNSVQGMQVFHLLTQDGLMEPLIQAVKDALNYDSMQLRLTELEAAADPQVLEQNELLTQEVAEKQDRIDDLIIKLGVADTNVEALQAELAKAQAKIKTLTA